VKFVVPYPPSVNTYWRTWQGRTVISKKGRDYRDTIVKQGKHDEWMALGGSVRLAVTISAHMPDRRRRDLDNTLKALLDSLQHASVFDDDEQIDRILIERAGVEPPGYLEVEIETIQ
jgi:crossover junction endodeoxyribonuclease RusA